MITLLLLACSLPGKSTSSEAPPPPPPPPPAEVAAAPAAAAAEPTTPAGATPTAAPAGTAPARIYVGFVSHNEEQPNRLCTPVVTDQAAYENNRAMMVKMAKAVVEHKAAWDMQNEWEFLEAVRRWDTPTVKKSTDGKNLIEWMAHLDPKHIAIDAHSHERVYNYADVVHMLEELGAPRNGVVGGFIYYPAATEVWTRLRKELPGKQDPKAKWKAEVLWGAATLGHGGPDARASGIWRPKDPENFLVDDPNQSLVHIGSYQYGVDHDFTGVDELLARLKKGELQAGHQYTASVFFHQCDLDQAGIDAMMADVDRLAPEVAAGNLVWSTIPNTVAVWRSEYNSVPTTLAPLGEAPPFGGGKGGGGPRGPRGPGGGMPPGGGRPPMGK